MVGINDPIVENPALRESQLEVDQAVSTVQQIDTPFFFEVLND